jgi:hypothetical protein
MRFFSVLVSKSLFKEYADALDWILCDGKFDKSIWDNKNRVQAFTKAIHHLNGFSDSSLIYDAKKNIVFPARGSYKKHTVPVLYMAKGESEARDLVRHIRNGIAHGNIEIYEVDGRLTAEIIDFGKEENQTSGQTAYLLIPLEYLNDIFTVYRQKESAWKKGSKKK